MIDQAPLPVGPALRAVARCVARSAVLLAQRRVHLPTDHVGMRLRFADGTAGRVYRETVVDRPLPHDPCVLVVRFRLRGVRGRAHALFRAESLLNTPLFVGFPGLVSKLWVAHDEHQGYRGVYQWDGAQAADDYARALWRVLALVSARGSIRYHVLPGRRVAELFERARVPAGGGTRTPAGEVDEAGWWRVVAAS